MNARDEILARARRALADQPGPPPTVAARAMVRPCAGDPDLFASRLIDYRAEVTRCTAAELPAAIAAALDGVPTVVVPAGTPSAWLSGYTGAVLDDVHAAGAVVTGCAAAIAETGTVILDSGAAQGPRLLSLIPDHHVCVVYAAQVHADVPDAIAALRPTAPQTWISGPSATSDIELDRVEGVHGPRRLHVILAG